MKKTKPEQITRSVILYPISFLVLLGLLTISCNNEDELITKESIIGYVQKGPYINGSALTLAELNNKLNPSGKVFSTQIADNQGSFEINDLSLSSKYVELRADGFYFNEILGGISSAQLTLFSIADVSDQNSINVNLLTQLEKGRVEYLMEEGLSFTVAKKQAQGEVLNIFFIDNSEMRNSELLDISREGEDNAAMLAVSLILQGHRSVGDLTEFLANISNDIREDGVLDNPDLEAQIINSSKLLNLNEIRSHLASRYNELGVQATIPDFEYYINQFNDSTVLVPTVSFTYPDSGYYGPNILNLTDTIYEADYSDNGIGRPDEPHSCMKVILPSPASKIKVTIEGKRIAVYYSQGWVSNWDPSVNDNYVFHAEGQITADLKIHFSDPGTATIKIYENNLELYPRVKVITLK